jgi:dimethylglycine dehydrogenase
VEQVRVLIIGGGVVGCSCLYHLTMLGWTDAVLLERNDLTSGSTWHAAGNCPTFSTSWGVMKLQQYSASLYRHLGEQVDYPINYHVTGSIRLAHTTERLDEYRHVIGMARANGLEYQLLTPAEVRERHPLVELHDIKGGLWDPCDGDIDPAQLTQAFAAGARRAGAHVQRFTRVTGLKQQSGGGWLVNTDKGDYLAEVVVNAAGYRAGEVMGLLGQTLPIVSLSHQYLVTEEVPELTSRAVRVPLLRDPDDSFYLRQERGGLILGPYEHQATAAWLDGIPDDFAYKLWPDDLERLQQIIELACRRVPVLTRAGIKRVVNGPIPYSPDGLPYLGPAAGLRNFFHCNTFSFGITQAGGAGKALAEWVVDGAPEWDLWAIDPRRFSSYATPKYALAKAVETYQQEYAPAFPYEERPAGRPLRMSPLHQRLQRQGAVYGSRGGWERALWYDGSGQPQHTLTFRRERYWMEAVRSEVHAVRNAVGVMDLPGFTRFMIEGRGAERFLDSLLCSRLPRQNRVSPAYALDAHGHILSVLTLTRLGPQKFYAVSAASAELHDADLFMRRLPADGSVNISRLSERFGTLVIVGPRARDVLRQVTRADLSNAAFPWLTARWIEIGTAQVLALRINSAGELGWELHVANEYLSSVYETLLRAGEPHGLRHFGLYALDSLRMDKCYRQWKIDLDSSCSPFEAALDRFVDLTKADFIGKDALVAEKTRGVQRRLVPLLLESAGTADALPCSSVFCDSGERVGIVSSGTWSHTLQRSVALAYVRPDLAAEGTRVRVEILGERCPATVGRAPLFDPDNSRLRS